VVLLVDVFSGESDQLGDPQAGVEQRPDNQAILVRLTCCGQAIGFVRGEGFAFVLAGHMMLLLGKQ
jgi:hypothetical protein